MKYQILAILFSFTLLTGCAHKVAIKETVQKELVPVPVVPAPPDIGPPPQLKIDTLSDQDRLSINTVAKAMTITIEQLKDRNSNLEAVYNKYKELSNTPITVDQFNKDKLPIISTDKLKEWLKKP